jgi:hypothetical protein
MNTFLFAGMIAVTAALIFYSIFILQKKKNAFLNVRICTILSFGVIFDITGTILMIIGSKKIPLTVHGIIGYTALAGMIIETLLMWRYLLKYKNREIRKSLNMYTLIAYSWWLIAYFAGGALAMFGFK